MTNAYSALNTERCSYSLINKLNSQVKLKLFFEGNNCLIDKRILPLAVAVTFKLKGKIFKIEINFT